MNNNLMNMNVHIPYPEYSGCCMCLKNQYLCDNKKCIQIQWKCNGNNDCGDNSDEHTHANCTGISESVCDNNEYTCSNRKCVHLSLKCNGEDNCGDNSDEPDDCKGIVG